MAWWLWLWVAVMSGLAIAGVLMDISSGRPVHRTVLSFGAVLACPLFVLHYFGKVSLPGAKLFVVLAAIGLWLEMSWASQEDRYEPDHSRKIVQGSVIFCVIVYAPALVLGWLAGN
ncbi:MAG TPA: hypothetical protein VK843_15500 [Planctomycetota bacterium]|nr:hypothetical protein [Planctomycetota bacterium]